MVTVRPRAEEDIDECVRVLKVVHKNEGYPRGVDDFRDFITKGLQKAWVADIDGQIVGHVAVGDADPLDLAVKIWKRECPGQDNVMLVRRLYVLPGARKHGAATRLLEQAAEYGRENNVRLILFVLLANEAAIRLYRRLEWEEYGTDFFRFGENLEEEMRAICFASPTTK